MKGYELIKEITERKIKNNTKIKVKMGNTYKATLKYKNLMLKWQSGDFDTSILCSTEADFEVIEENKEIEELDEMQIINARPEVNAEKINELVRAVNKINKKLEEQETEDIEKVEIELNKIFNK